MLPKTTKAKAEELVGCSMERKASFVRAKEGVDDTVLSFIMVSSENEGVRYDWSSGEYFVERLDPLGAEYSNLNTFFKNHDRSVESAVGSIINLRKDADGVYADVRFGSDDGSQLIAQKYREGLLTDVSIGYDIKDYKVEEKPNERDMVTVTSYEIRELSAVGVGFDKGAKQRSQETKDIPMNKEFLERLATLEAMTERSVEENTELKRMLSEKLDADKVEIAQLRAEKDELVRQADINTLANANDVDEAIRSKFLGNKNLKVEEFLREALASKKPEVIVQVGDTSNRSDMLLAIEDSLAMRFGLDVKDAHKDVDMFRTATMSDIAKAVTGATGYNKDAIAERAMVSADFPLLLLNVGNRMLEMEFEASAGTYRQFVKEVDVSDFRSMTDITTGVGGRLDKITERGELKNKNKAEASETWNIESFGNQFDITRKMIINDDLGAFQSLLAEFGAMAGTTANGLVYDLLLERGDYASYLMADGFAVFNTAEHGNKASGALDATTLSAGRLAMTKHKAIDGNTPLNIAPRDLIIGSTNAQTAFELNASTASLADNKNSGVVNYHQGAFNIIVDAEIGADEWFLGASRRTIKVGYLAGTGRRPVLKVNDSTLTKTIFEGVFDFGVMAEDYRGLYRGK